MKKIVMGRRLMILKIKKGNNNGCKEKRKSFVNKF